MADEDGRVLGSAEGPAGAYHPERAAQAAETVRACVVAAAKEAGVELPLDGLGMGIAGTGRSGDRDDFLRHLKPEVLARRWALAPDTHAALWGAFPEGHGIVVIAGTGAVAYGRSVDGREAVAGGWGRDIDDEGGAWWLGREVLRAAARAADGRGPDTALVGRVMAAVGCEEPRQIVSWVRSPGRTTGDVAQLAILAGEAAAGGDEVARGLVEATGRALAEMAAACARKLGGEERVALVGGLAERAESIAEVFRRELGKAASELIVVAASKPAVLGAIALLKGSAHGDATTAA